LTAKINKSNFGAEGSYQHINEKKWTIVKNSLSCNRIIMVMIRVFFIIKCYLSNNLYQQ